MWPHREKRTAKGKLQTIDPPMKYARHLVNRGAWSLPSLRGVISAPTLAFDGRIIQTPGYDADSGLLLTHAEDAFPQVPESPSHDDALRALQTLEHPLRGFPFVR